MNRITRAALGAAIGAVLLASALLAGCGGKKELPAPSQTEGEKPAVEAPAPAEADPRLAFESTGLLAASKAGAEGPFALILASQGLLEAGPEALGGERPGLAYALSRAKLEDCLLAGVGSGARSDATPRRAEAESLLVLYRGPLLPPLALALPSPAIGLASSSGRLLVLLAEGEAACYDGELRELWRRPGPADRALALPEGKLALAGAGGEAGSGFLAVLDSSGGKELWVLPLRSRPSALGYAAGLLLSAEGREVAAYREADGHEVMRQSIGSEAVALASGSGRLALLMADGSLEVREASSGSLVCRAVGSYDPGLEPLLDGSRLIAASGEGIAEIDLASGARAASHEVPGPLSSLGADNDSVYGLRGSRLFEEGREASPPQGGGAQAGKRAAPRVLPDAAASALISYEGGLCFVGRGGSLFASGGPGAKGGDGLEAALAPPSETAEAIASSLDKFKAKEGQPFSAYLSFDLFVEGLPVEPGRSAFAAYRLEPEATREYRVGYLGAEAGSRILLAVFSSSGAVVDSNFDDYGLSNGFASRLEKGSTYWLVAGRLDGLEGAYSLSVR